MQCAAHSGLDAAGVSVFLACSADDSEAAVSTQSFCQLLACLLLTGWCIANPGAATRLLLILVPGPADGSPGAAAGSGDPGPADGSPASIKLGSLSLKKQKRHAGSGPSTS
eukprot:gene20707-27515_t